MRPPGNALRELARSLFNASGATRLARRLQGRGARILLYHRFPAAHRAQTERQMAHLRGYYRPRSLTELGRRLAAGAEPEPRTAVITVDDGYRDFYDVAYPILKKHRVPAILFVATGHVDGRCWLWGDRVLYCVRNSRRREIELSVAGAAPLRLALGAERADAAAHILKEHLKTLDLASCEAKLAELEEATRVRPPQRAPAEFAPCSWEQMREMARGGIEFGAHTVTHPILSRIEDAARLRFEVLESKRRLEQELQRPVRHFAYPNGLWRDFGAAALGVARAHFDTAVSAEAGWCHAGTDRHQLFRIAVWPQMKPAAFEMRVAGASPGVRNGRPRPALQPLGAA